MHVPFFSSAIFFRGAGDGVTINVTISGNFLLHLFLCIIKWLQIHLYVIF